MPTDTPRVLDVESWQEMEVLRRDVRRRRRRLDMESLALRFVWQPGSHPYRGLLWTGNYFGPPSWSDPGRYFCSAYLPEIVHGEPSVCEVFLRFADDEVSKLFGEDVREFGALMHQIEEQRHPLEDEQHYPFGYPSGLETHCISALFSLAANELVWSDNEEPGQSETYSRVAELKDAYWQVECFLVAILEVYAPATAERSRTRDHSRQAEVETALQSGRVSPLTFSPEQIPIVDRLRASIQKLPRDAVGRAAPPESVLRDADINDGKGRELLRRLEVAGEYNGYIRQRRRVP